MRTPKPPGKPIDNTRIKSWCDRFDGYRIAITSERINSWLKHFGTAHVDLGARVLDAVTFLNSEDMEGALRALVGRLPGWHREQARRRGKWRFLAFSIRSGESGDTMLHKARTALSLTGSKHDKLFIHKSDLLNEGLDANDSVVFFDDFAGTGQQACRAWREAISELLPGAPKTYLILVAASQRAVNRITQETGLKVRTKNLLYTADDIFSDDCQHFTKTEKDSLLEYCRIADRSRPRGFGDCGFVVVLAHRTPNNSIPVLHANHQNWRGLFSRS